MAFTAHKTEQAMEEIHDDPETFRHNVEVVVQLIRNSPKTVFFTGAGISTSAGIPDYRGPDGVWTLAAKGEQRSKPTTDMMRAVPTPTHMAIVQMLRSGVAHFVVSQNVDGLHRKSGVAPQQIAELHGNSNIEICSDCGRQYLRDYHVSSVSRDHSTGSLCEMPGCGGVLKDNIINFHENLVPEILNKAFMESQQAGLHICLGSSLTVRPANEMPRSTKEAGGKLVIVNLQRTPLDKICDVRVHASVDEFMTAIMAGLGLPIPPFELHRRVALWRVGTSVSLCGVEEDGMPSSLVRSMTVTGGVKVQGPSLPLIAAPAPDNFSASCTFFGHYNEPDVSLALPKGQTRASYDLRLKPLTDTAWTVTAADFAPPDFSPVKKLPKGQAPQGRPAQTTAPRPPQVTDFTGWHAVTPLEDCPHCSSVQFRKDQVIDLNAPCGTCGNVGENMICMQCGVVECGRHVQGHMLKHTESSGHPMVCGMMDISFWCYPCEAYIAPMNPRLRQFYAAVHLAKFGCIPWA